MTSPSLASPPGESGRSALAILFCEQHAPPVAMLVPADPARSASREVVDVVVAGSVDIGTGPVGERPAREDDGATIPMPIVLGAIVGLAIGFMLGMESRNVGAFYDGGLPRNLGVIVSTGLAVVGLAGGGLLLLIPRATRTVGAAALLASPMVIAGFVVASAIVPGNPGPQTFGGTARVELTSPTHQVLEAAATCETPGVPDRALLVYSSLGRVGLDDLVLQITLFRNHASASVAFRVNGTTGYEGSAPVSGVSSDQRAGSATFDGVTSRKGPWLGGREGSTLSGSLSWDCSKGGALSPAGGGNPGGPRTPTPTGNPASTGGPVRYLGGTFTLRGLVAIDNPRVSGSCDLDLPYGIDALETVVAWPPGGAARLRFEPGSSQATITVDRGDGSTPQSVVGPGTYAPLYSGAGTIIGGTATGAFELQAGHLALEYEWYCQ